MTRKIRRLYNEALARFEGHDEPGKTIVLFCHHGVFAEWLREPIENRLDYIVSYKSTNEIETRLTWIRPYLPHPKMKKADMAREKAYAEWKKAGAKRDKAYAEYEKAYAEAYAKRDKACAEYEKAYAEYEKAYAEAYVEWEKACAAWPKAYEPIFMAEHPDCPWNGKELVFPSEI